MSAEVSRRRLVTFTVALSIDAEKGDALPADEGWIFSDGEYGLPITGLALNSDLLVWELARTAIERYEHLSAIVIDAFYHISTEISSDPSEF